MPIKDAGKKAMRSDARKAQRNRIIRGTYRSQIKALITALDAGNVDDAKKIFIRVQKALDKAVAKNVIKKNTAARRKSRLSKRIKNASA